MCPRFARVRVYGVEIMRKKINIVFILALVLLSVLGLVACNKNVQQRFPFEENGGNNVEPTKEGVYLKFDFTKHASSVFNAIFVDEFDVSDVQYTIVHTKDGSTTEVAGGALTTEMIDEADKPLLSVKGHHMIHASLTLDDGKVATGSFALHLKDRNEGVTLVNVSFDLKCGSQTAWAHFGTTDKARGIVTVKVEDGARFESWSEFLRTFSMSLEGKAVSQFTYTGGTLSPTSGFDNGFVINGDTLFTTVWTDDVVNVSFNLALPSDATVISGQRNPAADFEEGGKNASQKVQRNMGKIIAPVVDEFNVYNGYYFAGWYVDDFDGDLTNDRLWTFAHTVGSEDIALYAKWTQRKYSFTLFTTGGRFVDGIKNSTHDEYPIDSEEKAKEYGYKIIDATSHFVIADGQLSRIILEGFRYGEEFSGYVAKVQVEPNSTDKAGKTVFLKIPDIVANLTKGENDYVKVEGVFKEVQCKNLANTEKIESDADGEVDSVGYVKWTFNEPAKDDYPTDADWQRAKYIRLSRYIADVVFKDGISVKQDGSLCLDKIADCSVNHLIIPDSIIYNGQERPITEISAKAALDLKSLVSIDMSGASNLKKIGEQAFAHCSALEQVVWPENNNIREVGQKAFYSTEFERDYKEKTGLHFIVINNVLYKYVGDNTAVLNLNDYYTPDNCALTSDKMLEANTELNGVVVIASGAFENCKSLETLVLSKKVEEISAKAFENLTKFKTLDVNANDVLKYVDDAAFDGCELMLSSNSSSYVASLKAIIIGKVYYRFIDNAATKATVPADVKYIAPRAFLGCGNVATVEFLNESNIEYIGKEAFFGTEWVRHDDEKYVKDGFVIVNGILACYHNEKYDGKSVDIVIPAEVRVIVENAFSGYAQYVKTVQIGANVSYIANNAFIGASSLESLIFTDAHIDENRLVDMPTIEENSFVNSRGAIVNGANIFVREEVMNALIEPKSEDSVLIGWSRFYNENSANFVVEKVSEVYVDQSIVSPILMQTSTTLDAFRSKYTAEDLASALVVKSNTGVVRHEALDFVQNEVKFIKITKSASDKFASLYEEGIDKYVLTFTYHGETTGCAITADAKNLYVATVTKAIKGTPAFYSSSLYPHDGVVIKADGLTEGASYYIKGFDGQVDGASVPTFYTSNSGLDLTFVYQDIDGNPHELPVRIDEFSSTTEKRATARFTVEFNGLGTYKFSIDYAVVISKYVDIEQTNAISVPLNGNTSQYFGKNNVDLVGQDGLHKPIALNLNNFKVLKVDGQPAERARTNELGMHTLTILYSGADALQEIEKTIVYSVVLDADASLFTYEIVNERNKTARITGCRSSATYADTIVLPSTCTIDNQTYTVAEIGNGAFKNLTELKAVYLSTTITKIHEHAFSGCTLLEDVFTARLSNAAVANIAYGAFEEVRVLSQTEDKIVKEVRLLSLLGIEPIADQYGVETISVGSKYTYIVDGKTVECIVSYVAENLELSASAISARVFMPDTVFNDYKLVVKREGADDVIVEPLVYSSASGNKFFTAEFAPAALAYIGNAAFNGCQALNRIDLTRATGLSYIGALAFANTGLVSIDLSQNVKLDVLNNQTFENCFALKQVELSDSLKVVGASCFNRCTSLDSIIWGVEKEADTLRVQVIANDAFANCKSLAQITLGVEVASVGSNAFLNCACLTVYCEANAVPSGWDGLWNVSNCAVVLNSKTNDVATDGLIYVVIDDIRYAIDRAKTTSYVVAQKWSVKNAVIPASISYKGVEYSVSGIEAFAFDSHDNLESIRITSSIKFIREEAFSNCTSLVSFEFADFNGLEDVSLTAFEGCDALKDVPNKK